MGPRKCCVCGNRNDKCNNNGNRTTFHKIPTDKRRAKWCEQLGINPELINPWAFVCAKHITSSMTKLKLGQRLSSSISTQNLDPDYILPDNHFSANDQDKTDPGVSEPEFIVIKQEQYDLIEDTSKTTNFSNAKGHDPLISQFHSTTTSTVDFPNVYLHYPEMIAIDAPPTTTVPTKEKIVRHETSSTVAPPVPGTSKMHLTYNQSKGSYLLAAAEARIKFWKLSSERWRQKCGRLEKKLSRIKPIYTTKPPMREQPSNVTNKNKLVKVTYTDEQREKAVNLFKTCGRKGYKLLCSYGYELPHFKTVEKYLSDQKQKIKNADSSLDLNVHDPTDTLTDS